MISWDHPSLQAAQYAALAIDDPQAAARETGRQLALLDRLTPGGATVLDWGCGPGRICVPFAAMRPDCTVAGWDPSAVMRDHARTVRNAARATVEILDSPGPPASSDVIWCVLVAQHLDAPDFDSLLQGVDASLTPGGLLILQYVAPTGLDGDGGPLSYPRTLSWVIWHLEGTRLSVEQTWPDEVWPTWRWLTARRPG